MNRRSEQPDTRADLQLRECIAGAHKRSFVMVAGAGSGKTTSLIKALAIIAAQHGEALERKRQRVACITYTEIAANEILADIGDHSIFHVSTIHSFLWSIVKSFQKDIRAWVVSRIEEKLVELRANAAAFGPRVQERTRERNRRDIERYEMQRTHITTVHSFKYGTSSDYLNGELGHDDVIKMVTHFLIDRPLFRALLAQQFPFVFVDESQDTTETVVSALKAVERQMRPNFCLGFFGDPMQRIYPTGVGKITHEEGWVTISKQENFRCPTTVLAVANAIRRNGDELIQTRGRTTLLNNEAHPVAGTACMFVLPANEHRDANLRAVREWMAHKTNDAAWGGAMASSVKTLVIVHRMAAIRLGFGELYAALNDQAPESFKNGFLDATAWPIRPFVNFIIPLSEAVRNGREFEAMSILREHCPLLVNNSLRGHSVAERLLAIRTAAQQMAEMMDVRNGATNRDILRLVRDSQLYALDPRLLVYLDEQFPVQGAQLDGEDISDDGAERESASMGAFLQCPAPDFWGYVKYVNAQSPFSTQQGIKGAEFDKVLVILDDEEGTHVQFSYDKYFGIKPPSASDTRNLREGKETAVERTRRLFYVCCTRALTDLAVVLFSADVNTAMERVRAAEIFPNDEVYTLEDVV